MIARGVFALLWFYLIVVTGHAETISGPAQLLDGDTLRIEGVRIRLNGIDAPETDQTCLDRKGHRWACGIEARDALSRFIAGRSVSCAVSGADVYGRKLATCSAGGENLNVRLVREGRALAYRKYSLQYVADEEAAHAAGRGLWAGAFIAPWDWRHRGPGTSVLMGNAAGAMRPTNVFAPRQRPPDAACVIKGNVNRRGERIYHMPGQRDYGRVNMASSSQKRWFCTEEEAQAAGWRKALR
jgi:endonuclease YncB( thermonuclease family)